MDTPALEALQYPIGKYSRRDGYNPAAVEADIQALEALPRKLHALVSALAPAHWDRTYRPGGWTIRQVANHIADCNTHNYIRFKFALTEDNPIIKPFMEDRWAALPDSRSGDPRPALELLAGIQAKWVQTLRTLSEADLRRTFYHPERNRNMPLFEVLAFHAWHGEHHLGHIRKAAEAL